MLVTCTWNTCLLYTQNDMQTEESLRPIVNLAWRAKFSPISKYSNAKYSPNIIESLKRSSYPTSCSKQSQHWMQTRLLRTSSGWVLKTSNNVDITTSPGTLTQCWIILMGIFFFLIPSQTKPFQFMTMVLCSPACLCLLGDLAIRMDRQVAVRVPHNCPFSTLSKPQSPSLSLQVRSPAPWPPWWLLNALVYQHHSRTVHPKTRYLIWNTVQWVTSKGE